MAPIPKARYPKKRNRHCMPDTVAATPKAPPQETPLIHGWTCTRARPLTLIALKNTPKRLPQAVEPAVVGIGWADCRS